MARHHKEVDVLLRLAARQGWRVRQTGSNHFFFLAPDGVSTYTLAGTPGPSGVRKARADLRALGLTLDRSSK